MFIPPGKPVYENLATSYVLVEALVDDLCEGGFSGIVEVVLRDTDSRIVIERGKVAAVVEEHRLPGDSDQSQSSRLLEATVEELASRARRERGRISVYSFSPEATAALAGLVDANPLYTALSTDFADLGKMITKLRREADRQWFIEVSTLASSKALLYIEQGNCLVIGHTDGRGNHSAADSYSSATPALERLLEECHRVGGTFDVYLRRPRAAEEPATSAPDGGSESESPVESVAQPKVISAGLPDEADATMPWPSVVDQQETYEQQPPLHSHEIAKREPIYSHLDENVGSSPVATEPMAPAGLYGSDQPGAPAPFVNESSDDEVSLYGSSEQPLSIAASASATSVETPQPESASVTDIATPHDSAIDASNIGEFAPVVEIDLGMEQEAEVMADVKRLMGEITRTIDEACRSVEPRDVFPMYLRAGQLKIANRYPFLDPFGADFEYLGGEIEFVGRAGPAEFIEGLVEGLRLAYLGVVESSAQPSRVRAYVSEDLNRLLSRLRPELERFGLDRSIELIVSL